MKKFLYDLYSLATTKEVLECKLEELDSKIEDIKWRLRERYPLYDEGTYELEDFVLNFSRYDLTIHTKDEWEKLGLDSLEGTDC